MTLSIHRRAFLVSGAAAGGLIACGKYGFAATQWDMSFAWPSSNFHVRNGTQFAAQLAAATDDTLKIVIHDSGSLGIKGPEAMAAVRDGIIPIAEYSFEQQTRVTELANFGAMPGLAMGYDETAELVEVLLPALEPELARLNQKLVYVVPWPGQGIYAKKSINSLSDLRGLKIRAANNNAFEFLSALGASPILMPWAEVVPALATGVIDGVSTSSTSGVDGKFWEFTSHFCRLDWCNPLSFVTVNLDSLNALSEQERNALSTVGAELQPDFWDVSKAEDSAAIATLEQNGLMTEKPSPELKGEVIQAAEKIWQTFSQNAGEVSKNILKEFRASKA